ncbi:MAG: DUF2339 domain-containing protein [Akkermansiaceae bacterium]|nr:DUF2339 domain-containing protein [Akkermansiaceae bacterium]
MMDSSPQHEWLTKVNRLRERIDQAEARHLMVMEDLKKDLLLLEQQIAVGKPVVAFEEVKTPLPLPEEKLILSGEIVPEIPIPLAPQRKPPPLPKEIAPESSFEQELGRVWLVRIGIALLITGLVLGANWAYKNWVNTLPAAARLAGLYLGAFLISGTGVWLARKETLKNYGEVILAGGLAFFYYCTYAAHHAPRLKVVETPVAAALLLLGAAGVIAAVSWFRQSRAIATMGILLASYATMIQPLGWLSATSNLVLSGVGILLMLQPGWGAPGIASLLGTYGAFAGWQLLGAAGNAHGDARATLWFLPASWAIFAIPGMLGRFRESLGERGRTIFTVANNGLFFLIFSLIWLKVHGDEKLLASPLRFRERLNSVRNPGAETGRHGGGIQCASGIGSIELGAGS